MSVRAWRSVDSGVQARLLSHDRYCKLQGAEVIHKVEGNAGCTDIARNRPDSVWSKTPGTYTSALHRNLEIPRLAWADGGTGPRCESQGSTIAMNGRGKSDRSIVPKKRRTRAGDTPIV